MATHTARSQESIGTVSEPHEGTGKHGRVGHRYRRRALERTRPRLRDEVDRG